MKTIIQNRAFLLKQLAGVLTKHNLMFPKKHLRYAFILFAMLLSINFLSAQKKPKEDKVTVVDDHPLKQCTDLPREKRARIRVSRFAVTTSTSAQDDARKNQQSNVEAFRSIFGRNNNEPSKSTGAQPTLGENLATMLTTSLQNVNCFRVLDNVNDDNKKEINDDFNSKNSSAKAGHGVGAQILAVGEVTEYNIQSKSQNIMGVGSGKKVVKLGFRLKIEKRRNK